MSQDLHVVLGASGGVGWALITELAARGHQVRAVSRRAVTGLPATVEHLAADISTLDGAAGAVEGAAVVYHAAQPELARWLDDFPDMTRTVADATARAGAKLVFADNLYMYAAVEQPMTEDTPQRPAGPKSGMRAEMAKDLLADHAAGRLRVAIGRASDYFGPGGVGSALGEPVFAAALAGKPVRWLGPLDVPHTMSYLPDVARSLRVLGESDTADGRAWHLRAAEPLTAHAFTDLLQDALGRPIKLTATGPVGFWLASRFVPILRELRETRHQWQHPFISDATAFTTAFGQLPVTSHTEAMRTTAAWWRARADAGVMPASAALEAELGRGRAGTRA